jgi:hypothetical protein
MEIVVWGKEKESRKKKREWKWRNGGNGRFDFLKVYIIYERVNVCGWRGVWLGRDDERKEKV